ncbi:MAG: sulfotransferase [Gammaproteobacteria bacterium]|nr:sulfotransferase [Gammaproteobacteria bacterium]
MSTLIDSARRALESGNLATAITDASRLLRREPENSAALTICAQAYLQLHDTTNAAKALSTILKIEPSTDWALNALADIYFCAGHFQQADVLLRKALTVNWENLDAHLLIGRLMSERNELSAGEYHMRQALSLNPEHAAAHADLALNLTQQGLTDEAHEHYAAAHKLAPENVRIAAYWSKLFELCGDLDRAERLLRKVESTAAADVDLLRASFDARTGKTEYAMRILGGNSNIGGDALLERGRLYDRLEDYDRAWADFEAANRWFREHTPAVNYNPAAVEDFFGKLKRFFVGATISQLPVADVRRGTPQPIFIVGSPRSGTTMLEQMLISHSSVEPGGELPFLADLRAFSEVVIPGATFPDNLRQTFFGDKRHVATLFRDFYLAHAEERGLLRRSEGYFTDKMPFNEVYIPVLRMAFPKAPIIHIVRNPLDVCVSMFANKLNHGFNCAYRIEDIAHHLLAVHELHGHYREQMPTNEIVVQYETFVRDQKNETQRLLDAAGLPFEDACINFHETKRYAPTPSYATVSEAVSARAVGRHVHYRTQLRSFAETVRPLLKAHGYDHG